jgi:hypothetical protein
MTLRTSEVPDIQNDPSGTAKFQQPVCFPLSPTLDNSDSNHWFQVPSSTEKPGKTTEKSPLKEDENKCMLCRKNFTGAADTCTCYYNDRAD